MPNNLWLLMKRFHYDGGRRSTRKLSTVTSIDREMIFSDERYQLQAVVYHSGASLREGHYVTAVNAGHDDDTFCIADDERPFRELSLVCVQHLAVSVFRASILLLFCSFSERDPIISKVWPTVPFVVD